MSSLQDLPQHVQSHIIELVILDERRPPINVDEANINRSSSAGGSTFGGSGYGPSHVFYEHTTRPPNASSLLSTNKQLHKQTTEEITRLFPAGPRYKLDVLLVDETKLWPTWLFIPYLAKKVKSVETTFRVFGVLHGKDSSAFCYGDGSPPQIEWCFYYLMERFLFCGPTDCALGTPCVVHDVILKFEVGDPNIVPPVGQQQAWNAAQSRRWHSHQPHKFAVHPLWLAKLVSGPICSLLHMNYHSAQYGAILNENVDKFEIICSKAYHKTIDVASELAQLYFHPDGNYSIYSTGTMGHLAGETRVLAFWNWKWNTVNNRKQRGLRECENALWPTHAQLTEWKALAMAANNPYVCSGLEQLLHELTLNDSTPSKC